MYKTQVCKDNVGFKIITNRYQNNSNKTVFSEYLEIMNQMVQNFKKIEDK